MGDKTTVKNDIEKLLSELHFDNEELTIELFMLSEFRSGEIDLVFSFIKKILNSDLHDDKDIISYIDFQFRIIKVIKLLQGIRYSRS